MLFWILPLNVGYLCLSLGLTTRSHLIRTSFFLPLSLLFFSRVAFIESYTYSTPLNRLRPSSAGLLGILQAIELLLCFNDPLTDLRRDADEGTNIAEQPFVRRMQWAVALCASQRGAGWNWRVPGTPPCPQPSKSKSVFTMSSLLQFVLFCVTLDLLSLIFAFLGSRMTIIAPLVVIHAVVLYTCLQLMYHLGCFIWVGAGLGSVEECPPLFGSWRDLSSLRAFWGRGWHQGFRGPVTIIPNRFLAVFGLGPDKTGTVAFLMTGIYHALTVHAMTFGVHYHKTFFFFALQPLGFLIEKHILRLDSTCRGPPQVKANGHAGSAPNSTNSVPNGASPSTGRPTPWLGYAWTLTYLILTSRLYFSEMVESGFYEDARWGGEGWLPLKVLRRVVG